MADIPNAEANKIYWDAVSTDFMDRLTALPQFSEMYQGVTNSIMDRYKFDANTTTMMDFACGNGAITALLAPHCKTIVSVDISPGMVTGYKKNMKSKNISNVEAYCVEQGLLPEEPQLAGQQFDIIVCAQSYKHIDDNLAITRILKSFLKPRGELFIIETIRGKNKFREVFQEIHSILGETMVSLPKLPNVMSHMEGYTEDEMRNMFTEAGFVDFAFDEAFVRERAGNTFALFCARGVNPS